MRAGLFTGDRRLGVATGLVLGAIVACAPVSAFAQSSPPPRLGDATETREEDEDDEDDADSDRRRPRDEPPLRKMSRGEAEEAGFTFGQRRSNSVNTTGALIALTGGALVHGAGHWYIGDHRAAWTLFGMEGAAALLLGTGLASRFAGSRSASLSGYAAWSVPMGTALFGVSYLLDIVGALQGGTPELPANSRRTRGIELEVVYHFLQSPSLPLRHTIRARTGLDLGSFYVSAATDQDVSLGTSVYETTIGWRFWRGPLRHTFLYLEGRGELLDIREVGALQRWSGGARLGLSLDMGAVIGHLRGLAVGVETGYGWRWYRVPGPPVGDMRTVTSRGYAPLELFTHFNVSERLNTRLSYRYRAGGLLEGSRRLLGVGALELNYDSTDIVDLVLRVEAGGGFAVTGGLALWMWE